jgi:hypothetical protein
MCITRTSLTDYAVFGFSAYKVERGGAVVEALRYKPEGRGFDSQLCHWIFSFT